MECVEDRNVCLMIFLDGGKYVEANYTDCYICSGLFK